MVLSGCALLRQCVRTSALPQRLSFAILLSLRPESMKTAPTSDALDKLARQVKRLDEQVEVYVLPFNPQGPSSDNDLHVAVLADVTDRRMDELTGALAEIVEQVNVELGFDPFVVAHPTNRNSMLAKSARNDGVRL